MPSRYRIQFEGARYHVINRGNYRSDVFTAKGAAEAFLSALFETTEQFGWKLHAYVLMSNHYHLAVETPKANLGAGMHWLQGTFASRFNRLRKQNGRLFQGPYKALLIEDMNNLCRVVDYIHLNPVRAGMVAPANVARYEWSSLAWLGKNKKVKRPAGLACEDWLEGRGGWADTPRGLAAYETYLVELGNDEAEQKKQGLENLSRGWALGTQGWKQEMAKEYAQGALAAAAGLEKDEIQEIRQAHYANALEEALRQAGRTKTELKTKPRAQVWKIEIALSLRKTGVPVKWLAGELHMGKASSLRSLLSFHRKHGKSKK